MSNPPELAIIGGSALTRKIVEVAARREGLSCVGFPDGEEALRRFQEEQECLFRLILVETDLPGHMNGYTVVRLLRVCAHLDHTAIVMFTWRSDLVSRLRASRAGADAYLIKPFHRRTFLSVLSRYCTKKDEQGASGGKHEHHAFHAGTAGQNGNGCPGTVPAYYPGR